MANAKLTALPADTSLASTDILYVVIDPLTTPVSKQATIATVVSAAGAIAVTTVTASGLLTGGNISTAGTIGAASVTASGNMTATGGTLTLGTIVVARGTNFPALGTWNVGDILFNSLPAAGTVTGWICTVGGTVGGTWLGFGTL